jgi:hypothetical protein
MEAAKANAMKYSIGAKHCKIFYFNSSDGNQLFKVLANGCRCFCLWWQSLLLQLG